MTESPDRLVRATVSWFGVELPKVESTKYGVTWQDVESLVQKEHRHGDAEPELPLMIYFSKEYEGDDLDKELEFNSSLWKDEEVGVASKLFNCYRISLDDMESTRHAKKYNHGKPWILILNPQGKTLAQLKGWKMTGPKLKRAMAKVVRSQWGKKLGSIIAKQAKVLRELDEVHAELDRLEQVLASTQDHIKVHNCAPGRKRLKRTQKAIKVVNVRKSRALEAEAKVFAFVSEQAQKRKAERARKSQKPKEQARLAPSRR